jgi:Tfp pilus assembly protein PilF
MRAFLIAAIVAFLAATACSGSQRVDDDAIEASNFHYQLSIGHWQAREVPIAIRELNTALELNPGNRDAIFLLGFIYQGRKNYSETERLYRRALELDPEWYEVMNNLGTVYIEQRRWEEAEVLFHELTGAPTYATPGHAWNNLGWAQFNQRLFTEALESFMMAVEFQPGHCLAHNNLGLTYEELGNDRMAAQSYEGAIDRCDDYQEPYYRLGALLVRIGRDVDRGYGLLQQCFDMAPDTMIGLRCAEYVAPDDW